MGGGLVGILRGERAREDRARGARRPPASSCQSAGSALGQPHLRGGDRRGHPEIPAQLDLVSERRQPRALPRRNPRADVGRAVVDRLEQRAHGGLLHYVIKIAELRYA